MKQSKLFGKTLKNAPHDEISVNAQLLYRAGFIEKLMAGTYTYLPLGLRVLNKIKNIVRKHMDEINGQEILMPALQPRELWEKTGRWEKLKEIMFQFKGRGDSDLGLATTHEEVITEIVSHRVQSYKDLPVYLYQIQDKFRNEPRAKSGLLRGREFSMKDLYSFHANERDFEKYYDKVKSAYLQIFEECGLEAKIVEASGGDFTKKVTHEFQVLCDSGEDTVYYCENCDFAQNSELESVKEGDKCPKCQNKILSAKAIEVGNIFPLETTYSKPLNLKFTDEEGKQQTVVMGSYGIGPSRVMGSVVEVHHDEKGIIWPINIAPYQIHLVALGEDDSLNNKADNIYEELNNDFEVLYDDRKNVSFGEKLADSDLLGMPMRIIISQKTLEKKAVEVKIRNSQDVKIIETKKLNKYLTNFFQ